MVCLLVFLTVWVFGKLGLLEYFVFVLPKSSDEMHLPTTGAQYAHIAIDICVVLFWAVFIYFILALAIVRASTLQLEDWAEADLMQKTGAQMPFDAKKKKMKEFAHLKLFFREHVRQDQQLKDVFQGGEIEVEEFPLWLYLRANVRVGTDVFFQFGVIAWMLVIITFVFFMYLHYFMHMGYIRIMTFFLCALLLQLGIILWFINRTNATLQHADSMNTTSQNAGSISQKDSIHARFNTESIIAMSCFYNVFILCYGIARVVCQPWMWELHFWVVIYLLIFTSILYFIFCVFVAPQFPLFFVAMAMPPYMDPDNIQLMKDVRDSEDERHIQEQYLDRKVSQRHVPVRSTV